MIKKHINLWGNSATVPIFFLQNMFLILFVVSGGGEVTVNHSINKYILMHTKFHLQATKKATTKYISWK